MIKKKEKGLEIINKQIRVWVCPVITGMCLIRVRKWKEALFKK